MEVDKADTKIGYYDCYSRIKTSPGRFLIAKYTLYKETAMKADWREKIPEEKGIYREKH